MTEPTPTFVFTPLAHDEMPSSRSIQLLKSEVYTAASSVPSTRGGGTQGHLGLVMSPVAYAAVPGTQPWNPPDHPGPRPTHPVGATGPVITEINRQYKVDISDHRDCAQHDCCPP